jgi:aldose sugar dehydrogenase
MKRLTAVLSVLAFTALTQAQQVAAIWKNQCASCHGSSGAGGEKVQSLLAETLRWQDTDRRFFDAIRDGTINGKVDASHAFGPANAAPLDNPKVWGLVNHLRELQARDNRKRTGSSKPDSSGVYTSAKATFKIETVLDSNLDVPWSVDFIPANSKHDFHGAMLVTNRSGSIALRPLSDPAAPVLMVQGLPAVRNFGQGGLMDIALHPTAASGWIYLSFTDELKKNDKSHGLTKVVRGRLSKDQNSAQWTQQETIFQAKAEHYLQAGVHFGSKFAFDPKDPSILFFGIGEHGHQDMAQDITRPNGKIHRLKDDGSIPKDNPFVGSKDAYESIWSFGHRNPQGLTFDLEGNLWDTEHAPRGGDELNLIVKAKNYGWPLVSFGINYSGAAFRTPWVDTAANLPSETVIEMPKDRWLPSIAACGMCVVDASQFPQWKGDLLCGGLAGQNIDRVRVKNGVVIEREEVLHGIGRVRDVVNGPDGAIYIVLNGPDRVIRLVAPAPASP